MKNLKKRLVLTVSAIVISMTVLMLPVFATTVKAQTPKDAAKKATKQLMTAIKKCDDNKLSKFAMLGSDGYFGSAKKNSGLYSFLKKSNSKMTYKIKGVKVNGDTADVKVKVKMVDSKNFIDKLVSEFDASIASGNSSPQAEELYKKAASANCGKKNLTITLHFAKYQDRWVLTSQTLQDDKFTSLCTCNMNQYVDRLIDGICASLAKRFGKSEDEVKAAFMDILQKQYGM